MRHINVIDMYHGNAVHTSDFVALKDAGIFGIIHKVSQGTHYRDPKYQDRRKAALDAGLLWGGYHFQDHSNEDDQAKFFLDCINTADFQPMLISADYENSSQQPTLGQCYRFMKNLDAFMPGMQSVLYSGNLIRETLKAPVGGHQGADMIGIKEFFQQHRLWLAQYGPVLHVPYPWNEAIPKTSNEELPLAAPGAWLWQFTETGRVNPLVGNTDGNFFDGTFEQLQASWLA